MAIHEKDGALLSHTPVINTYDLNSDRSWRKWAADACEGSAHRGHAYAKHPEEHVGTREGINGQPLGRSPYNWAHGFATPSRFAFAQICGGRCGRRDATPTASGLPSRSLRPSGPGEIFHGGARRRLPCLCNWRNSTNMWRTRLPSVFGKKSYFRVCWLAVVPLTRQTVARLAGSGLAGPTCWRTSSSRFLADCPVSNSVIVGHTSSLPEMVPIITSGATRMLANNWRRWTSWTHRACRRCCSIGPRVSAGRRLQSCPPGGIDETDTAWNVGCRCAAGAGARQSTQH